MPALAETLIHSRNCMPLKTFALIVLVPFFTNCYSQTSKEFSDKAEVKLNAKDYAGAINEYNKALEIDSSAILFYQRGNAKFNFQDYKGALEDCNKAIRIDASNAAFYTLRGEVKSNLKDYESALVDFNTALAINRPLRLIMIEHSPKVTCSTTKEQFQITRRRWTAIRVLRFLPTIIEGL